MSTENALARSDHLGHNHPRDGKLYPSCEGCIEERWLMLRLQGRTKQEADAQLRKELAQALGDEANIHSRQVEP